LIEGLEDVLIPDRKQNRAALKSDFRTYNRRKPETALPPTFFSFVGHAGFQRPPLALP
jgi:hypothetical protein